MILLFLAAIFFGTLSIIVAGYMWIDRQRIGAIEAARERLRDAGAVERSTSGILRDETKSELALLDRLLSGKSITARIEREIRMAGLSIRPGNVVIGSIVGGALGWLVGGMFSPGGAFAGFALGLVAPSAWLSSRRRKREQAFKDQLPEAIDMLVSATRAGYSFQMAMKFIGEEMEAPVGTEFTRFYDEQRLGMDVRTALLSLQERVDNADLKMFVTAVLIQRETGGNLGEALGNIADVMRQRVDVQRQIDTLTAESKMSARFLSLLPVIVFAAMFVMDPEFLRPLVVQPVGRFMLMYAAISLVAGYWVLSRAARVPF